MLYSVFQEGFARKQPLMQHGRGLQALRIPDSL